MAMADIRAVRPTWLITGGAGYIGSHVVQSMLKAGMPVAVVDDLSTGDRTRVPREVPFLRARVSDIDQLGSCIADWSVGGIVHLAGSKQARESLLQPLTYWRNNVLEFIELLRASLECGVTRVVLSSSSSVYGSQAGVDEQSPLSPASPYGHTKLACEQILKSAGAAHQLSAVSLRYFNVIGCGPDHRLLDRGADNVLPRFLEAVSGKQPLLVYGTDRPTRDGSCVRDYIDVRDVATAHVLVAKALDEGRDLPCHMNLSTGAPTTVLELAHLVNRLTDRPPEWMKAEPSNPADPDEVWSHGDLAQRVLGWVPGYRVDESVASHIAAWRALREPGQC